MDKKILAIGLVAVVLVIGVAAYFVLGNSGDQDEDDGDEYVPLNTQGRLMVFGNANNDDYLDNNDLKLIEKIVSGEVAWDKVNNRFADANNDNKISSEDVELVKKLIAREHMDIWFVDGNDAPQKIKYPVKNIAVIGKAQMVRTQALDVLDNVVAISGSRAPLDPILHKTISDRPVISNSPTSIDIAMYSNVAQTIPGGIDAVFCNESGLMKQDQACKENGITLLRMNSSDNFNEIRTYLTLGYLLDSEERSHALVDYIDNFNKMMDEKLAKVTKKVVVTPAMYGVGPFSGGNIFCKDVDLAERITAAGGQINITADDLNGAQMKKVEINDIWHLDKKFQGDFFVDLMTGFGYQTTAQDMADFWGTIFEAKEFSFTKMDAYPAGFSVLNRDVPALVNIAYLAEFFYPEVFEKGFGDKIHQEYGEMFFQDLKGFDASKTYVFCSYDDVKDLLKK